MTYLEALKLNTGATPSKRDGWSSPIDLDRKPREWPISEWVNSPCLCMGPSYVQTIVDAAAETAFLVKAIFEHVKPLECKFKRGAPWWLYRGPEERLGESYQYAVKPSAFGAESPLALRPAPPNIPQKRRISGEQEEAYLRLIAPLIPTHVASPVKELDPVFWWLWRDNLPLKPEHFPGALPLTGTNLKEVYSHMRVVIVGGGDMRQKALSALHHQNERSPLVVVVENALRGTARFYSSRKDACAEHQGEFWHFIPYYNADPDEDCDYEFEEDEA